MDRAASALSLFEAWERADYDGVMAHLAGDVTVRDNPRAAVLTDASEIRGWMESWRIACPDSTAGATVPSANADSAVVEGVYAGTNTGPLGSFPATGRAVSMPFSIVMRFDDGGLINDYSVYYDQLTLLTQLGHLDLGG
jgi:steroid delta-isomerase-like uncharacterized protein